MGALICRGASERLKVDAEVMARHPLSNRAWHEIIPRKTPTCGAAGAKLLQSHKVRVRFVLVVFLLANAAACERAGGKVRGDGAVERASVATADVSGSPAGLGCTAGPPMNLNASVVDVLIVFDGSESMGIGFGQGTRYSVLAAVLSNLVDAYQSRIRFGFAQFPGANSLCQGRAVAGCCAGPPSAGVAPDNGVVVQEALKNVLPLAGNTPTALALQRAREYYAGLADYVSKRYVLLATDGLPSCTLSGALSSSQPADADGGVPSACQDAVDQVDALAHDHITVMVVAVGAEPNDDPEGSPECLEQMAQAGGMPYYSAASPDDLQTTIEQIFGGVERTSCSFELTPPPTSPDLVSVYLDGQQIPRNQEDGWDFDSAGDAGATQDIRIYGEYCHRIEHFRYSSIQARYGCRPCADNGGCT